MKTYSGRQLLMYCVVTAIWTVALLAGARVILWPLVTAKLGLGQDRWPWARALDLSDPEDVKSVRERYDQMIARRGSVVSPEKQEELLKLFSELEIYKHMYWLGIPVIKTPSDMWMMQQVIAEVRPDYIIEAGTAQGGSALYFAHVLQGLGLRGAKVITIDIYDQIEEVSKLPLWQERVEFILGSSTDSGIVSRITQQVKGKKVLVALDSNHTRDHVLQELKVYSPLVSPGSYIIVEDTCLDGVPLTDIGLGPMAAAREFLESDAGASFSPDATREAFLVTLHPGGWLRKVE